MGLGRPSVAGKRHRFALFGACCQLGLASAALPARTASAEGWPGVHVGDTFTAGALRRALDGAARRLRAPGCSDVFSSPDLLDQNGQPLQARLTELETDGAGYLARLAFYDASSTGTCRRDDVLAFTTVGAAHVFICGPRFLATWKKSPHLVEITVIHETLHTLGLGENPPSSRAITRVVRGHCDHVSSAAAATE